MMDEQHPDAGAQPGKTAPSVPAFSLPEVTVPAVTVSSETGPAETVTAEAVPTETVPAEKVTAEAATSETVSTEYVCTGTVSTGDLQTEAVSTETAPAVTPASRFGIWVVGAMVALLLLITLTARSPDRIKLLGLFPILWGAAAGAALAWWANENFVRPRLVTWICAGLLLVSGQIGIVLWSWDLHRTELQEQFAKDPSAGFVQQAQQSSVGDGSPEEQAFRQQLQQELLRVKQVRKDALSLPAFLRRRLKVLGPPDSPWPELFWCGEIVGGALAGLWVFRSTITAQTTTPSG